MTEKAGARFRITMTISQMTGLFPCSEKRGNRREAESLCRKKQLELFFRMPFNTEIL